MTILLYLVVGYSAFWYLFLRDTFERDGAVRFSDAARDKILAALNSTVPVPVLQPAFAEASTFQATAFRPASASTSFLIETARGQGFPVAVSEHALEAIAAPDERPVFVVTMRRGAETTICAPGNGFALVAD